MQETQEMWVQSLCWEDPLEEEIATHSSITAWRIPWTVEPGRLQSMEVQSDLTERLNTHMHTHNGKESENYIHYLLYIYN